jgi:hypothetical protein
MGLSCPLYFLSMCQASALLCRLLLWGSWGQEASRPLGVTSILNFAPETLHHEARSTSTVSNLSLLLRYTVVLSMNRFTISLPSTPGKVRPSSSLQFLSLHARGSIARSKRRQERGSPCCTPLVTWNGLLNMPFIATWVNVMFFFTILCLPCRLSLGLLSLLHHHPLHAQTLLIAAYSFDSGYDSFLLLILVVFIL